MIQHDTIFTNVAVTADDQPWWEGLDSGTPVDRLAGQAVHAGQRARRASECALHRLGEAEPDLLDARGCARRRADLGDPVRRPPPRSRAAGVRSAQLVARRAGRRRHGVRNDRCGRRADGRRASRLDGDEAVLRLQLRRLLEALAVVRGPRRASCRASSTSTGSARTRTAASCGRASAKTCACCAGSPIAATARSRRSETPIGFLPRKQDLDVARAEHRRRDARDAAVGRPGGVAPRDRSRSASIWTSSASACRRSCAKS